MTPGGSSAIVLDIETFAVVAQGVDDPPGELGVEDQRHDDKRHHVAEPEMESTAHPSSIVTRFGFAVH
jgi:hypothetical protein